MFYHNLLKSALKSCKTWLIGEVYMLCDVLFWKSVRKWWLCVAFQQEPKASQLYVSKQSGTFWVRSWIQSYVLVPYQIQMHILSHQAYWKRRLVVGWGLQRPLLADKTEHTVFIVWVFLVLFCFAFTDQEMKAIQKHTDVWEWVFENCFGTLLFK